MKRKASKPRSVEQIIRILRRRRSVDLHFAAYRVLLIVWPPLIFKGRATLGVGTSCGQMGLLVGADLAVPSLELVYLLPFFVGQFGL